MGELTGVNDEINEICVIGIYKTACENIFTPRKVVAAINIRVIVSGFFNRRLFFLLMKVGMIKMLDMIRTVASKMNENIVEPILSIGILNNAKVVPHIIAASKVKRLPDVTCR